MPGPAKDSERRGPLEKCLEALTRLAVTFPLTTLALCLAVAGLCIFLTQRDLKFQTSRADLIDPHTDYHQRWLHYTREFGDVTEDMVVVVEGARPEEIQRGLDDLGACVERETRLFKNVLFKVDLARLRDKALQYSSPEQLHSILAQLEEFHPLLRNLGMLTLQSSLRELRQALELANRQPEQVAGPMSERLLQQSGLLVSSLEAYATDPDQYESPWQGLMPGDLAQMGTIFRNRYLLNEKGTMGFLKVQPTAASSDFNGTSPSIGRLRELIVEAGRRHPELKFGLTGIPVLECDEMRDSQAAMFYASILSFAGVAILMFLGFRGFRYPLVGSAVLLVGMAWSFGFTTLVVGHLNILSVSFAAMLIGIGIDYSTVYLLRYLEIRHAGVPTARALLETATSAGAGIWTAAISSAVAFFCAIFTDFAGVAELGIIASGGILICTVAAFVVLPAILIVIDRHREPQSLPKPLESQGLRLLAARFPMWTVGVVGAGIAWLSTYGLDVKYDYNLLHLQSKGLESVEVQTRIFDQSDSSLLFAVSLADDPQQVLELKRKFEALPSVHHVEELAAILPRAPADETQLLVQGVHAELSQLPARVPPQREVAPQRIGQELEKIASLLAPHASPAASILRTQIDRFLDQLDGMTDGGQLQFLRSYQGRLAADLLARLRGLEAMSISDPVSPEDLTPSLVGRFLSPNGKWLLQIYPAAQIWDIEPLEKFISDVRSVDPEATGTPLQTYEASKAIKRSYETIGLYALLAVCLLLFIDFRDPLDCAMALLPPIAGAAMMFGLLALLHVDLNPANLIVLPLVIGLGVDGGVHVVHDYRQQRGPYLPTGSVINAIIVNATTTMVGFGSMMIAAHQGLYSLGLVLTIGVGTCLVVAVVLLPAVLTLVSRWRASPAAETETGSVAESTAARGDADREGIAPSASEAGTEQPTESMLLAMSQESPPASGPSQPLDYPIAIPLPPRQQPPGDPLPSAEEESTLAAFFETDQPPSVPFFPPLPETPPASVPKRDDYPLRRAG